MSVTGVVQRRRVSRLGYARHAVTAWTARLACMACVAATGCAADESGDSGPRDSGQQLLPVSADHQEDAGAILSWETDAAAVDGGDSGYALPDAGPKPAPPVSAPDPSPSPLVTPPAPSKPLCQPTTTGPYDVLESEPLTVHVTCKTGLVLPAGSSIAPLPLGASYDAQSGTLRWTPTLDQASSYLLSVHVGDETAAFEIFVIDRAGAPDNLPVQDASQYHQEYGLPVIHLTTDPALNGDEYTPATIVYRGHTFVGSEAKYRGATSSLYPKRSFTLKFTKDDKFSEAAFAGGFTKKRKIVLTTTFDDNSYVRQRLGYELWNRLDPAHIQVQSYNAVLFLNGEYYGLYTVSDHVDEHLMEDFQLSEEGNLYKARTHDANFRTTRWEKGPDGGPVPKDTLHDGYTKEEGTPADGEPGAYEDLDAFIAWVETASDNQFASEIDSTIARKDYEDWWIFASFIMADDSSGKNSYHYHDPALAGSLWRFVPWDLNSSFGQNYLTQRVVPDWAHPEVFYLEANGLFARILADDTLGPALRARYDAELHGPYALDKILVLYDAMVSEVEASARRDERKWAESYRSFELWRTRTDFTSFEQEAQYVRQWLSERHAYIDAIY